MYIGVEKEEWVLLPRRAKPQPVSRGSGIHFYYEMDYSDQSAEFTVVPEYAERRRKQGIKISTRQVLDKLLSDFFFD